LLRALATTVPAGHTLIYFDALEEYGDLCTVRVEGTAELASGYERILGSGGARVQVLPAAGEDEQAERMRLAELVVTLQSTTRVVDEADAFLAASRSAELAPIRKIVRTGRHSATAIWAVGRRPADVDRLITSQSRIIAARTVEPRDLAYFQARYQADIPWASLGEHEFFAFADDGPEAVLFIDDDGKGKLRAWPAARKFPRSKV